MTDYKKSPAAILAELSAPFPASAISWRVGSTNQKAEARRTGNDKARPTKGVALAYIDARDVLDRLDAVVGIDGWQETYTETPKGRIICALSIKFGDQWITKSDGAGETDHEGEKGAISDALKRAAVHFGVGRYLYRLEAPWVELDERGHFVRHPSLPDWAVPGRKAAQSVVRTIPPRDYLVDRLKYALENSRLEPHDAVGFGLDFFKVPENERAGFAIRNLSDGQLYDFLQALFDTHGLGSVD